MSISGAIGRWFSRHVEACRARVRLARTARLGGDPLAGSDVKAHRVPWMVSPPGPRAILAALGLAIPVVVWLGTGYAYEPLPMPEASPATTLSHDPASLQQLRDRLLSRQRQLRVKLARAAPRGLYIVVDQSGNRLDVRRADRVLLSAVCSSGSGMVLIEGQSGRRWAFDTPRGRFHVLSKLTNPVWRRPDWAFVEEGLPVPSDPAERLEYGSLGEYALYLGKGYMIHGTLYERLLGRSVTHGCIRLGREDLRTVYKMAQIGTPVFVY